jgi:MFS family permease
MPSLSNRWAVLALVFLARTCMAMQFQAIPPLTPFLKADLGLNFMQIGMLIGSFMAPGVFLALPGGLLGQRYGDKKVVAVGLALLTLGAVLLANSSSYSMALSSRLVSGVGAVLLTVQLTRTVTDWFAGREIATAMGIQLSGWPLGIAIALATLGGAAEWTSWQGALYLVVAATAVPLIVWLAVYPARGKPGEEGAETRAPFWNLSWRETGLVSIAGTVWMFVNTGFIVFVSFMPALLIARGAPTVQAGVAVSVTSWLSLLSVPLGGWLTDRTSRPNLIISLGAIGSALAIWAIPLGAPAVAMIVLFGFTRGAGSGGIVALPAEVLRPENRSVGLGVFFTAFQLGMALLPPLAGYLFDLTGEAEAPIWFAGLLWLIVPACLLVFRLLQRGWPLEPEPAG